MSWSGELQGDGVQPGSVQLLPYGTDPLAFVARAIINEHRAGLPDLDNHVVLLANPLGAASLRRHLLEQAARADCPALLGPHILGLHDWIDYHYVSTTAPLTVQEQLALLLRTLRRYRHLPGAEHPWLLTENLINLFDELDRYHVQLDPDPGSFREALRQGYGHSGSERPVIAEQLDRESRLVHTLWLAWREQLDAEHRCSRHDAYRDKLRQSLQDDTPRQLWLVGHTDLLPAECEWLSRQLQHGRATLILQTDGLQQVIPDCPHPDSPVQRLLDRLDNPPCVSIEASTHDPAAGRLFAAMFDNRDNDFMARADRLRQTQPDSPVARNLRVLHADSEEQQALAIDLKIRTWLAQGYSSLGIVTQNRRLARRVRALLERSGVSLLDSAGWALSTTSAAAALERWLECIELDFDHLPLLDLLKSGFIDLGTPDETLEQYVYRFEQDIIIREAVPRGLANYVAMLQTRRERLQHAWPGDYYAHITTMLERLEYAAAPLQRCLNRTSMPAGEILVALQESLDRLGMAARFGEDDAGIRLLEELNEIGRATRRYPLELRFPELRHWLARSLEKFTFRPATHGRGVQLLDLDGASALHFDGLVIAAADRSHLPGTMRHEPFFNASVRHALGLPGHDTLVSRRLHIFRGLLEAATETLITTHRIGNNGEPVIDSPWLEVLTRFHARTYTDDLEDTLLAQRLHNDCAAIRDTRPLPAVPTLRPAPHVPAELRADRISASNYQHLVDCPYRYYASQCLHLKAPDEISELLSKGEYGELVHRCLQAFHSKVEWLPEPFTQPITAANRAAAISWLEDISAHVFANVTRNRIEHDHLYHRWQLTIPAYIDWQIQHGTAWRVSETEAHRTTEIPGVSLPLYGRLDRIDRRDDPNALPAYGVIDYKTGHTPKKAEVLSGEAVQLPFYALLLGDPVEQVEYLGIDTGDASVASRLTLAADDLADLQAAHRDRLALLATALREGHALPAYAGKSCDYCDMDGLCRVEFWSDSAEQSR